MITNPLRELYLRSGHSLEWLALEMEMSPTTMASVMRPDGPGDNTLKTVKRVARYFGQEAVIMLRPLSSGGEADNETR